MKKNNIKFVNILIVALTFHVFFVNSQLLFDLNFNAEKGVNIAAQYAEAFSSPQFRFYKHLVISMLLAVSYSLATIAILRITKSKKIVRVFALLDSVGVLLYYFNEIPWQVRGVFFAVYTYALINSFIYYDDPEHYADRIVEMKKKGVTQKEIAKELDLSPSKVSRVLKQGKERKVA